MQTFAAQPMIFVTGASRSGTTMLANMLRAHSEVAGLNEMQYFGEFWDPRRGPRELSPAGRRTAVATLLERQSRGILAARGSRSDAAETRRVLQSMPQQTDAAEVFAATVAHLARGMGRQIPCEQTPRNIYYAKALLECYPQARFVHLVRDPRGVMASQKHRWRRRSLMTDPSRMSRRQQLRTWVNYHPFTVARLWNLATSLALALRDHPRFLLLRFEDLIESPEAEMREVCAFLGLSFQSAMLDTKHVNSSYVSVRVGGRGLDRRAIAAWRTRLSADERALACDRCGPLMDRLGYQVEAAAVALPQRARFHLTYAAHVVGAALINPRRAWIQGRALAAAHMMVRRGPAAPVPGRRGQRLRDGAGGGDEAPSTVFGLACVDVALDTAARDLVGCAVAGVRRRVVFVNAHSVNVSVRDRPLQWALSSADVVYADGIGMAMAARLQGTRLQHNVNGTDLFPYLCREAARHDVPMALLGSSPPVVETCVDVLRARYPDLRLAWWHHGFIAPRDNAAIVDGINRSGARILLVAMGVPRQERWILENAEALQTPVTMGVGGLFDFVSGHVPRAPRALRTIRMEWLYRLLVEPRRLWARYVVGNPVFLARAVKYALTGQVWSSSQRRIG